MLLDLRQGQADVRRLLRRERIAGSLRSFADPDDGAVVFSRVQGRPGPVEAQAVVAKDEDSDAGMWRLHVIPQSVTCVCI